MSEKSELEVSVLVKYTKTLPLVKFRIFRNESISKDFVTWVIFVCRVLYFWLDLLEKAGCHGMFLNFKLKSSWVFEESRFLF